MKKMWRRLFLITALLTMALSVHALADTRLYSARNITFDSNNTYHGGWSNQFTLTAQSTVTIDISITENNQSTYINQGMIYVLENVSTHKQTSLSIPSESRNALNYTLSAIVPAGTYSFGAYYYGSLEFKLHFSLYGSGGISIPDSIEVMKGTSETVSVSGTDTSGNVIKIKSAKSSSKGHATVKYSNSGDTPTVTVKGVAIGSAKITVTGTDGSTDTMSVKVVKYVPSPTLNYKTLTMNAGDKIYNAVENATSSVKWSSSNKKVAKVTKKGRITAVGYGKCTIRAVTTSNGKQYSLACTVSVKRTTPDFKAKLLKYYPSTKTLRIRIQNLSAVPMTVYRKNAAIWDTETDTEQGTIKLKSGKSVTVAAKKTAKIDFKLSKKLSSSLSAYKVQLYLKQDKRYYFAQVFTKVGEGLYCWRKEVDKWYPTYTR